MTVESSITSNTKMRVKKRKVCEEQSPAEGPSTMKALAKKAKVLVEDKKDVPSAKKLKQAKKEKLKAPSLEKSGLSENDEMKAPLIKKSKTRKEKITSVEESELQEKGEIEAPSAKKSKKTKGKKRLPSVENAEKEEDEMNVSSVKKSKQAKKEKKKLPSVEKPQQLQAEESDAKPLKKQKLSKKENGFPSAKPQKKTKISPKETDALSDVSFESVETHENENSDSETIEEIASTSTMEKCISTLLKQYCEFEKKDGAGKKSLFAEAPPVLNSKRRLCLTIDSYKVPAPPSATRPLHPKIFRFVLPHGLTDGRTSVLLVTKDYPKRRNPRLSNEHFRQFITSAGCNHLITEIMSVGQLRDEYSVLSARKELCDRIDVVLCDSSVNFVVPRLLGKLFLVSKKFPLGIRMEKKDLKHEIEKKLSCTFHKMTFKNTQSSLVFGHAAQPVEHLVDNLRASLLHLSERFPGGLENVKTLYITMGLKARVPLYISTKPSSEVPVPQLPSAKTPEVLEGDFGFGTVKVTSFGDVLSYKPIDEDEDDLLHVMPGMDEDAKFKYGLVREARQREERANRLWAQRKRFGYGERKEAQEKAKRIKRQNYKEVPLV